MNPDATFFDAGRVGVDGGVDAGSHTGADAGADGGRDGGLDAGSDVGNLLCGSFQVCEADVGCIGLCSESPPLLGLEPTTSGTCTCGSTGVDNCTGQSHCLCQICTDNPGLCVTPGQQACLCATSYNQTFQCETPQFDAGPPAQDVSCSIPADCTSRTASVTSCSAPDAGDEPSGESCIAGECVLECGGGGRTCTVTDGGCLSCGTSPDCPATSCGQLTTWGSASVELSTCASLVTAGEVLALGAGSGCTASVGLSRTTLTLGTWTQLADGALLADMPAFGGTCTGITLPTNAIRVAWSCPSCQFVVTP